MCSDVKTLLRRNRERVLIKEILITTIVMLQYKPRLPDVADVRDLPSASTTCVERVVRFPICFAECEAW